MVGGVYRTELRKLRAQRRATFGLIAAGMFALVYVIALNLVATNPDVVYGDAVRTSGLVFPLVVLSYAAKFAGAALITAIVAGDIFSAEDQADTLKTILTRSARRSDIFAGKVLAACTYAVVALVVMGVVSVLAGSAAWGLQPFAALTGVGAATKAIGPPAITAAGGLGLVPASYTLPVLGVVAFAILLSVLTRNSAVSIVGTILYAILSYALSEVIPGEGGIKPFLLGAHFDAWQGLAHTPVSWAPIVHAVPVCAGYSHLAAGRVACIRSPGRRRRMSPRRGWRWPDQRLHAAFRQESHCL